MLPLGTYFFRQVLVLVLFVGYCLARLCVLLLLLLLLLLLFTAVGFLPGGSGYFTCIENMKLVTNKFKFGGLREKHVVATEVSPNGQVLVPI